MSKWALVMLLGYWGSTTQRFLHVSTTGRSLLAGIFSSWMRGIAVQPMGRVREFLLEQSIDTLQGPVGGIGFSAHRTVPHNSPRVRPSDRAAGASTQLSYSATHWRGKSVRESSLGLASTQRRPTPASHPTRYTDARADAGLRFRASLSEQCATLGNLTHEELGERGTDRRRRMQSFERMSGRAS
jgi:hypothetical protein